MKKLLVLPVIAFGAVLAWVIGTRLSGEAMAVVVGAVCGITATIPVSIALIIASSQNWGREQPRQVGYDYRAQPPQVIVRAPQPTRFAPGHTPLLPSGAPGPNAPREFRMIGEENSDW